MRIKKPSSSKLYCEENLQTMNQVFFNGYFSFIFFFYDMLFATMLSGLAGSLNAYKSKLKYTHILLLFIQYILKRVQNQIQIVWYMDISNYSIPYYKHSFFIAPTWPPSPLTAALGHLDRCFISRDPCVHYTLHTNLTPSSLSPLLGPPPHESPGIHLLVWVSAN